MISLNRYSISQTRQRQRKSRVRPKMKLHLLLKDSVNNKKTRIVSKLKRRLKSKKRNKKLKYPANKYNRKNNPNRWRL